MNAYPDLRDLERQAGTTWAELTALEPELEELLWATRQKNSACRDRCEAERTFAPVRNALSELVGFNGKNHRHPVLGGSGAYQVAYWKLYDVVAGSVPHSSSRL
jgi:hypothetical protein